MAQTPAGAGPVRAEESPCRAKKGIEREDDLRKIRMLFLSILMAVPMLANFSAPAHACTGTTDPNACDVINRACQKVFKGNCVG